MASQILRLFRSRSANLVDSMEKRAVFNDFVAALMSSLPLHSLSRDKAKQTLYPSMEL